MTYVWDQSDDSMCAVKTFLCAFVTLTLYFFNIKFLLYSLNFIFFYIDTIDEILSFLHRLYTKFLLKTRNELLKKILLPVISFSLLEALIFFHWK